MTQHESAAGFSSLLETMAQLDFFTLVLPFVLSYVIFFLALKQVPIFKEEGNDKFPALVAVISSFFVAQFIAVNPWYQRFFVEYFGSLTIGMIGILGLLIILGLFNWDLGIFNRPWMALVFIAIAGAAFLTAGGFGEPMDIETDVISNINWGALFLDTGLIWILIIAGVLYWVSQEPDNNPGNDRTIVDALFNTELSDNSE